MRWVLRAMAGLSALSITAAALAQTPDRSVTPPQARPPETSEATAAPKVKSDPFTPYAAKGLFHGGYWSREEAPGHWTVNARVYGNENPSRAFLMALYRSAELVSASGYAEFKINGQSLKTTYIVSGYIRRETANYLAILDVVAVGSPAQGAPCLAKNPRSCFDITVAKAFALAGPKIGAPISPVPMAKDAIPRG
jgi:hypothetical protein